MNKNFKFTLLLIIFTVSICWALDRELRSTTTQSDYRYKEEYIPPVQDDQTWLRYHDHSDLPYYIWLPEFDTQGNPFSDIYFAVRFTPPFTPYQILATNVFLFYKTEGNPDMEVILWHGTEIDNIPQPSDPIDSILVRYENLLIGDSIRYYANNVYFRWHDIINDDASDFYAGFKTVVDSTRPNPDRLAAYFDWGTKGNKEGRSLIYNATDEFWIQLNEAVDKPDSAFNFAITALVSDPLYVDGEDAGPLLGEYSIDPAFPNPFNSSASIRYNVPVNQAFTMNLYNSSGNLVRTLVNGVGSGRNEVIVNAESLPSGTYIVRLSSQKVFARQRLILLR